MTKGKKLDEATKNVIRAEVKEAAKSKNGMTKKQIAELHGIHPTMISKIMNEAPVKAAPKRAKAKKNSRSQSSDGTKYTEADFEAALNNYIMRRAEFRTAEELLRKVARELK